jgi:hypothetical protein
MARAKMFFKDSWKGYVRSDIVSCLLLGSAYTKTNALRADYTKAEQNCPHGLQIGRIIKQIHRDLG